MQIRHVQTSLGPVSYRQIGNGSRKVLFFHGFPGSSAQIGLFYDFAEKQDLEILCFDRPGYHHTRVHTTDMLGDTLQIARELMRQQNWQDYEVACVSGGTPYGLSLALRHPENIKCVRVICGLGYLKDPGVRKFFSQSSLAGLSLLPYVPGKLILAGIKASMQDDAQGKKSVRSAAMTFLFPTSPADDECLKADDRVRVLNQNLLEAMAQNALGPKRDAGVFMSDWGKDLASLKPPIHFWHGDEDYVVPGGVSEAMVKLFPKAGYTEMRGEGHLSLPILHTEKIMRSGFTS